MNTAEILRAAAARVRQGWCQYTMQDDRGRVCALGAISEAAYGDPWELNRAIHCRAERHRWQKVAKLLFGKRQEIHAWNNAKGQTAENVAQGLEYAALLWEQEQQQSVPAPDVPVGVRA